MRPTDDLKGPTDDLEGHHFWPNTVSPQAGTQLATPWGAFPLGVPRGSCPAILHSLVVKIPQSYLLQIPTTDSNALLDP